MLETFSASFLVPRLGQPFCSRGWHNRGTILTQCFRAAL